MGRCILNQLKLTLQSKIIILVCIVVAISLFVTNILVTRSVAENVRHELGRKATDVARVVARSPLVISELAKNSAGQSIQDYAESVRNTSNVEFVVVFDMQGIRKSHPDIEKLGKHIVGGDEAPSLQGEEYLSAARGTRGLSLRAFSPIFTKDGRQVGAVVVGILLGNVEKAVNESQMIIYMATVIGMLIGIIGAVLLARSIKKTLFGLEPPAIAKLAEERNVMLQSVREGILAVDKSGVITVANQAAKQILQTAGIFDDLVGRKADDVIPRTRLNDVLISGAAEFDKEQDINGVIILTNRVPLKVNNETVGSIATFRDMTEIRRMAEELTGVNAYVEALRSQAHEFLNKLHVILGLVCLKKYDRLTDYIAKVVNENEEEVEYISERIKNPLIAGFLLSKLSRARELDIQMILTEDSYLPDQDRQELTTGLITIIGNLLDNAFEAITDTAIREVMLSIKPEAKTLVVQVLDSGAGLDPLIIEQIFEKGFSTKAENRGWGLYLVSMTIEKLHGQIDVFRGIPRGMVFKATLPL